MSMRRFLSLVDVLLRVPPLFVIDEIFKRRLGLPQGFSVDNDFDSSLNDTSAIGFDEDSIILSEATSRMLRHDTQLYKLLFTYSMKFFFSVLICIAALCTFVLTTKHILIVYKFLLSGTVVFMSYYGNLITLKTVKETMEGPNSISVFEDLTNLDFNHLLSDESCGKVLLENLAAQCLLASVFYYVHLGPRYPILQRLWGIIFITPTLLAAFTIPFKTLNHISYVASVIPLAMVNFVLCSSMFTIIETVFRGYRHARTFVSNFGLSTLMEVQWMRLNVPCVLRAFWLLRLLEQAIASQIRVGLEINDVLSMAKYLITTGCDTLTAVLGMTSVVSYICHHIGRFIQWILLTEDDDDDKSMGTVSAVLFYILALQTGLTGLPPEKRFIRLCRNLCLLVTAILHFIHNHVSPLLMSLSASHNPSLHKHVRALLVCLFLIVYPVCLLTYLWTHQPMCTFLLAVSAFSIEVIFKVIVSLLLYMLFLIDSHRATLWEKLDDYIYYIKAFGNTVEFMFGLFLFFNGAWILMFESGGAIRAGMMGIHAYFNIWCDARAGWSVFMKRRTAVNKIESLPEASEAQLAKLNDVCAICYQEMKSAKITKCNHFFHGICLRKWLYVQDRCPLCHDILYKVNKDNESIEEPRGDEADNLQIDYIDER